MRRAVLSCALGAFAIGTALLLGVAQGQEKIAVHSKLLDGNCPGGYQVSVADVDGDGKLDVLTLGKTVRWLKNDAWRAFPISTNQTRNNIDLAPYDIDGDGKVDLAVASDFSLDNPKRGKLQWFHRTGDLKKQWQPVSIADVPSVHRIRWADIDGTGHKVLVAAPILGASARGPRIDGPGARLCFFRVPTDPVHDRWHEQLIDDQLHVIHGLLIYDFDGDGRDDLLTASFEGVYLFQPHGGGKNLIWKKTHLAAGEQDVASPSAAHGSSEIRVGRLKNGVRFLATIEPWHGNKVVVYTKPAQPAALWDRHVIDTTLDAGHALAVLDMDGDGNDEIVAGYRGKKGGVLLFRASDDTATHWTKEVLDQGTLACQGMFVADVTGTGHPADVGIGGSTHNVKLFWYKGK